MFGIKEKYEQDKSILECDHARQSPPILSNVIFPSQQKTIDMQKEVSVISLKNIYLELEFDTRQLISDDFANGTDICLVNVRSFVVILEISLTTSNGKPLENTSRAQIIG